MPFVFNSVIAGNENVIQMILKAKKEQTEMETTESASTTKSFPCFLKEVDVNTWICYEE